MTKKKFKTEIKKTRPVVYRIEINGERMPEDIYSIVESLDGSDGLFVSTVTNSPEFDRWLVENQIAKKTARGGLFPGSKFKEFKKAIFAGNLYDFC